MKNGRFIQEAIGTDTYDTSAGGNQNRKSLDAYKKFKISDSIGVITTIVYGEEVKKEIKTIDAQKNNKGVELLMAAIKFG